MLLRNTQKQSSWIYRGTNVIRHLTLGIAPFLDDVSNAHHETSDPVDAKVGDIRDIVARDHSTHHYADEKHYQTGSD